MNLVLSMLQSTQVIRQGFVKVNGVSIKYINFCLKKNDVISIDHEKFFVTMYKQMGSEYLVSLTVKCELPYLFVRHRSLFGIFLYDPLHNYSNLLIQYPTFFFGKNRTVYKSMNFKKLSKNKRAF